MLVAVGTSLGDVATDGWSRCCSPSRAFVHVDIDARQLGRGYPCTLGIVAHGRSVPRAIAARLPQAPRAPVTAACAVTCCTLGTGAGLPPHHALGEIQEALPEDAIYTVDSGEHFVFATHYLRMTRARLVRGDDRAGLDGPEHSGGDRRAAGAPRSRGGDASSATAASP